MYFIKNKVFILFTLLILTSNVTKSSIEYRTGSTNASEDKTKLERIHEYTFSGRFKPGDSFYGKNITYLNDNEFFDQCFYMRHTLDLNLKYSYGFTGQDGKIDKNPAAQMYFSMRNKPKWGSLEIIPTTRSESKVLDHVGLEHQHFIPRHMFWIREAWLEFNLNDISGIKFNDKKQTFKLGAFPFFLGRGIALGDAYAVGADYLGFYSDSLVDQYAFGLKLSGEIVKNKLSYDIYGALLNNKSSSTGETNAKVLGQEYGKLNCPERGFGVVNIVVAGRLNITAIDNKEQGKLTFEPYAMVNTDKEQMVEFLGDTTSKLGTIGLACEYNGNRFEFGFDGAVNIGNQKVKGWDKNVIELQNRNGRLCFANSHVYVGVQPCSDTAPSDLSPYKALNAGITEITNYAVNGTVLTSNTINKVGKDSKTLITNADRDCKLNGQLIGTVTGYSDTVEMPEPVAPALKDQFYNATDRFRDPYKNKYKGFMFVTDGAINFLNKDLKVAMTAGYASGDADPNFDRIDGDYRGFIGLQEAYSGVRVNSAFYMGGAGKLKRPIDTLSTEEKPGEFAENVAGFTDLAFVGGGVKWVPKRIKKRFNLNPNILGYWQTWADRKFDFATNKLLPERASRFLGTEFNVFMEKNLIENLKVFVIASAFVPGTHYDDVKGKPINKDQQRRIDQLDRTGNDDDCVPNVGTDTAYAFNIGLEYFF